MPFKTVATYARHTNELLAHAKQDDAIRAKQHKIETEEHECNAAPAIDWTLLNRQKLGFKK